MNQNPENDNNEHISLRNCQFAYRCPMTWQSLLTTERSELRYCPECDRGVYLCRTDNDLLMAVKKNRCVAIVTRDDSGVEEPERRWPLGDIEPASFRVSK